MVPSFVAAIVAPVVWERFLLRDCVIEHRFVGEEKPQDREVGPMPG